MTTDNREARATTWLSCGLAQLAEELGLGQARPGPTCDAGFDFDVVIVGSGYGASIVLGELAGYNVDGHPLRIAMLERGREYVPGAFPSSAADLAGHVRFASAGAGVVSGRPTGLFDLRIGADVNVVQANGLGGGSLINAGVMEAPKGTVFDDKRWPDAIRQDGTLRAIYDQAQAKLMATSSAWSQGREATMHRLGSDKAARLPPAQAGRRTVARPVPITVAESADPQHGIRGCNACGDCATGCNFNAKLSVDVSLIADARRRHPAEFLHVVTDASVVDFRPLDRPGWALDVVHTDPQLRRHQDAGYRLFTRRLVLAAGALGSTELLMRARASGLPVSPALGSRFSTNGDMISVITGLPEGVNAVADEEQPFAGRQVGPTITRMIDRRGDGDLDAVIQDLAVPGPLRRLFEECVATATAVGSLAHGDWRSYRRGNEPADPAGIDPERTGRALAVAVIGDDSATGHLTFPAATGKLEQGTLGVVWHDLKNAPEQERRQAALERLAREKFPEARVLANPAWHPLSAPLEQMFGQARGAVATVHPLGGCVMGDSFVGAVVNALGQVYAGPDGQVHDGLVVLDGAIVPMALGINPALTISTLALRAIRLVRADWGFTIGSPGKVEWPARPVFKTPAPVRTEDTLLETTEQLRSTIEVGGIRGERPVRVDVELELWFKTIGVRDLIAARAPRVLQVDEDRSRLRLRKHPRAAVGPLPIRPAKDDDDADADSVTASPLIEVPLRGTLTLMRHEPSGPLRRLFRALAAWLFNRGIRDIVQGASDLINGRPRSGSAGIGQLAASAVRLASLAGDVRLLEYKLTLGKPTGPVSTVLGNASCWENRSVRARKRLTYACGANPVRQLMDAQITAFPNWARGAPDSVLRVDPKHWVRTGVPLLRIVSQRDAPSALIDLASLGMYFARVLLPLHVWTLRLPDRPSRVAARLPADLGRTRPFPRLEVTEIKVAQVRTAGTVHIRLSRYRPDKVSQPNPVMLIHGYSASGTTFVHECLPGGGLVGTLCGKGHDVWVLDMRSSCGMPTAQVAWRFEDMGCHDIPIAVNHILERTGASKVDIVAHCMGAAMLSLGLLMPPRPGKPNTALPLRQHLGKVVFSQAGPAIVVTPANSARAYVFQWLRHFLRLGKYEFTPAAPSVADDMVDRLLCVVPYPDEDFSLENPLWPPGKRTPWVAARHRMDALYGVTFRLKGLDEPVLERIDDFFGPLHLETVAQVISFARCNLVTDASGDGSFVLAANFKDFNDSNLLSLHSTLNGLFDFETRRDALLLFEQAGFNGTSVALDGYGHQDSLIGREAERVYAMIADFLHVKETP